MLLKMNTISKIIRFLCFISLLVTFSFACNEEDKRALIDIKNCWPPNYYTRSWNELTDCCTWFGLRCGWATDRVVALEISNSNEIKGPIPPSIAGLSALQSLVLSDIPGLVGSIPPQLSQLKGTLESVNIYNTGISGVIPSFFSEFTKLQNLNLGKTQITGPIPPSLGKLPKLSVILLSDNQLNGTIPASLFSTLWVDFGDAIQLDLSNNKLTGEIPRSFARLSFYSINLGGNRLTGDASLLFGKSNLITEILLPRNKLAFDLSNVDYPENLVNLDISHNQIYGSISDQITELKNLHGLDVSYNRLSGKIPTGGSMKLFDSTSYAHNKCLCGKPLPPCKQSMLLSAL